MSNTKPKILTGIFEIHKPSALITMDVTRPIIKENKIVGSSKRLLPTQHDSMNFLCYQARKQIQSNHNFEKIIDEFKKESKEEGTEKLMDFLQLQKFKLNIKDLISFMTNYQNTSDKKYLFEHLRNLNITQVEIGLFKQDKIMGEVYAKKTMSLLRNFTRIKNSNSFTYQLEPEILLNYWIDNPTPFTKLYLSIQTKLKLTYSKILYEICKDYEKLDELTKPFDDWLRALGFEEKENTKTPGRLKKFFLNKAIKEINRETDIFIDEIKGIKKDGKTSMTIYFHNQECDLIKQFKEPELSIEEQIFLNKKKFIARQKLDKILNSEYGQKIKDEDKWIEADIKKFKEKYESMINLDEWQSDMAKKSVDFRREYYIQLGKYLDKSMVGYDKTQYRLTDMFDPSTIYTYDPIQTFNTILEFVNETNILEEL